MSTADTIDIVRADLARPDHQRDIVTMTASYAADPMGNDGPLPPEVLERLIPALQNHPTTVILLAYAGSECVGIATCFVGFSTFLAGPLLNLHDLAVVPAWRGRGVGKRLLGAVEARARELGCGRITLEVFEHNAVARRAYAQAGFVHSGADESTGGALFYTRAL